MLPTSSLQHYIAVLKTEAISTIKQSSERAMIEKDELIMQFGAEMYKKIADITQKGNYIRNKLRELGNLILAIQEVNHKTKLLKDVIIPIHFQMVVNATMKWLGLTAPPMNFNCLHWQTKLGVAIKVCLNCKEKCNIVKSYKVVSVK